MPPIHDALRAHLAKLDREIILQHEVLTKLKHERTLARRELNAVLDPVARLPLEISSEIFLSCLATSGTRFPQPGALHLPMLLLNVCDAWSRIAVSTPSLWAGIHILFQDNPQSLQKLVPHWLAGAGNRPLSLSLSGYATFDSKVLDIVWSRARQLKHLELCEVDPERRGPRMYKLERNQRLGGDGGWTMDLWEGGTGPESLPALKTLAVRGLEGSPRVSRFPSRQIFELLRLAPNLIECLFRDVGVDFPPRGDKRTRLVLSKLRWLVFDESNWSRNVLSHLNLPALETLAADVHGTELLPFLEASSPPLRELLLAKAGEFHLLARCLRLVPGLRRLELCATQFDLAAELFVALAESRSTPSLLPQLSTLVIHFAAHADLSAIHGFFWPAALRALTARRTHLQVLHLDIAERPLASQMPALDIVVGFRELVADGMQVYIGDSLGKWKCTFD
ncbi:hypothetical protein B0H14DRAFT_2679011 [Mycena olivaceomarginata]|nr:hypothetical protein B0H14DRAFT_2679011 [Mycena olivaceomarginata]